MAKTKQIRDGATAKIPTQQGDRFAFPDNSVGTNHLKDISVTRPKLTTGAIAPYNTTSKTTTYLATTSDDVIFVSASASWTLSLYTAVGNAGRTLTIIRTDNAPTNLVTIDANGTETINGALTYVINLQYQRLTLISNGTNWLIEQQIIPFVSGTASGSTSSSATSYTDLSGVSITLVGTGRPVVVNFCISGINAADDVLHSYRLYVDGSPVGPNITKTAMNGADPNDTYCLALTHQFTPSLGSHLYTIRFYTTSGSYGNWGGDFSFNVTEVRD